MNCPASSHLIQSKNFINKINYYQENMQLRLTNIES